MAAGTRRARRRTAKEHGPDPVDIHVGRQLRLARTLAGMTQAVFGRRLGMSFQLVQKYEQGEIRIAAGRLYRMARLLDRPVAFFFAGLAAGGEQLDALAQLEIELVRAFRGIAKRDVQNRFAALVKDMAGRKPPGPKSRAKRAPSAKE